MSNDGRISVIYTTVNLCNQALGQESKNLIRYPGTTQGTRIEMKFVFFSIRSLDPGSKIEFFLKMALFNLIDIPGYKIRNIIFFKEKSITLGSCNILFSFFETKRMCSQHQIHQILRSELKLKQKSICLEKS